VIERSSDRVFVGNCTLHHFHEATRRAEIGYLLDHAYWGQGYTHVALQLLVAHAFLQLGLNRLEADIDPRNQASAKTLARPGFVKEGHLRQRWIVNDEVSDTSLHGLRRSDWRGPG
jgi:ribosomal-protein-alanine N-acetyltransferase